MFKKLKKITFALLLFMLLCGSLGAPAALAQNEGGTDLSGGYFRFDLRSITHEDIDEEKFIRGGINFVFERAITIMAVTIGSAAVLMITVGGFMILSSAGSQQQIDNGKTIIFKALIGLAVALGAYIMVQAVQLLIKGIYG